MSNEHVTHDPLYGLWRRMIQRCSDVNCADYTYYGARGITVCDEWKIFQNFRRDMSPRPEGLTLDRIDNNLGYYKDNCRWVSRQDQMQNTKLVVNVTYEGETHSISEWERLKGFKPGTLKARIQRLGYSVEDAFTKGIKSGAKLSNKVYKKKKQCVFKDGQPTKRAFQTEADKSLARFMHQNGKSLSHIARWFGVSIEPVSNLINRRGAYRD